MNRMEEWNALLAECDQEVLELAGTLDRAYARKRRHSVRLALQSIGSLAACFVLFVLLVNYSAPVAKACSRIPGLRELAQAVTFSRSLTVAVEHEYVQPIGQTQSANGITAEIAYLIVDQKQVNVFYRLHSQEHSMLTAQPEVSNSEGGYLYCGLLNNSFGLENGELGSFTIDFFEEQVPEQLLCTLKVQSSVITIGETAPPLSHFPDREAEKEPEYLAQFQFLLEFAPQFTAAAKVYPVNQVVEIDGQQFTIPEIEVYPSHLRLNVVESEENTAWIQDLDFYLETDTGIRFDTATGITAHSTAKDPYLTSYRAESTYFYESKELTLVITGARFLDKSRERIHLNLLTGESDPLPEGVSFHEAYRESGDWIVSFRADFEKEDFMHQLFFGRYFDPQGQDYMMMESHSLFGEPGANGSHSYFIEQFLLKDYPYDEVWLCPHFSHNWTPQDPIIVIPLV